MARHNVERSDRYCDCGWMLEMPTHILRPDAYPDVRHRPAREVAARCPESASIILGPVFAEKSRSYSASARQRTERLPTPFYVSHGRAPGSSIYHRQLFWRTG